MTGFVSDLRYAFRAVFKNPRFSLVAVAALALGIGANAAIFSVVNAVLLQPLPYRDAGRLVRLCREFQGQPRCAESIPKYVAWSRAQAFDAIAAYDFAGPGLNLSGGDRPEQIKGIHVSEGYFRVFGAAPEIGRTFSIQEDTPGGPRVAVITHKLWASRFASDPQMVGRPVSLNGDAYTVIGILPPRFRSEPPADVFIPLQADPNSTNFGHYLSVAAHLKPGVDAQLPVAQVRSMDDLLAQSIARQSFNMLLLTIFGAIALLLAAVGVYGIMSYSVEQATHDISVRLALGADRRDILSLVVGQGMKLAGAGLLAGAVAAFGASRLLAKMLYGVKTTDPQTYGIVIAVLGAIALLACYLPARRAMRVDPVNALKQD
jgi:ABC-type antimicrobial peptide transport system permease subunit